MPHRGYQIDQVSFFCVSMMDIWPKALTINQRVFRHILPEIGVHEMANIGLNSLFISLECLVSKETDPSSHKMPSNYYQVCSKTHGTPLFFRWLGQIGLHISKIFSPLELYSLSKKKYPWLGSNKGWLEGQKEIKFHFSLNAVIFSIVKAL